LNFTWFSNDFKSITGTEIGQYFVTIKFYRHFAPFNYFTRMTVETFKREITDAVKNFDRYVICLHKTPDEFEATLTSLMQKAIKAYEQRGAGLRHGIALDKEVTVILSQNDEAKPLCGIYFNLHSPYKRDSLPKTVKPVVEKYSSNE
jgi:hypothetical protein